MKSKKNLTVKQFRDRMKVMIDPEDGVLLFCYSKRDTNGKPLSEDSITQWINSKTQKRRKQGKKKKNQDKIDNLVAEEKRLIQEHKAEENEQNTSCQSSTNLFPVFFVIKRIY